MFNTIFRWVAIVSLTSLAACGGGGGGGSSAPMPTATLSTASAAVNSGDSTTLTWSSTNATACHASGAWSGALAANGTQSTGALTSAATYSLTCSGAGGTSSASTVTVNIVPTATLSADPLTVSTNGTSTLTWNSVNATACTASGGWSGALATSGSQTTPALTIDTVFTLTCSGAGGTSAASSVTVAVTALPTASLTAAPTNIAIGAASTLTWSSMNATSCNATGGPWTGTLPSSGTQSTGALAANTTYTLTCTGPTGTSAPASTTVTVAPLPTVSLSASPLTVALGGSSTLTWTSTNATSCAASGGWSGPLGTGGSQSTGALNTNTSFSVICSGPVGNSDESTVYVAINAPTVTLTANPTSVALGSNSTLTWTSTNATSCTASNGWTGTQATSGSQSTGALTANKTYSLICTGPGGTSTTATATVTIAAPTVSLSASPTSIPIGGTSTLTWSSTNATTCTASGGWSGTQTTSGSQPTLALTASTTYSLQCTGPGGTSNTATATVTIAAPTVSLSASPTSIPIGGTSTLTWSSTNATTCTASGGWSGTQTTSGSQPTLALTTSATYSLQCTGPGGTSATSSVTVYVVSGNLAPKLASLAVAQTAQFSVVFTGGGTAAWSVDGIANGNASVGTITAGGLYTAGTSAGRHTVLATDMSDSSQSASGIAAVTDLAGVFSYHNDASRDGANIQEYALQPSNVGTATFGKLTSCTVDGAIYTQPLWVPQVQVGGARHNVVLVATQHDGMFAFDADAVPCAILWTANLIDTGHGAASGEVPVPANKVGQGFGDISPEVGVTGTPVIDPATNTVYVVSKSMDSTKTNYFTRLHAIDLATGLEKSGAPVLISGSVSSTSGTVNFDSHQQLQRSGLALANGNVYVAFSAHEDASPWYGWVMGYHYSGSSFARTSIFNTAPNNQGAGIWMGGGAPSIDSSGNLYVVTGNGNFDVTNASPPNNDYGDSLLALTPSLTVSQYYTPPNQAADNAADKDFGSGGSTLLADLPAGSTVTHAIVCGGKDGTLLVLNRDVLGGFDGASLQTIALGHGMFSTPAFWNNTMYVAPSSSPLRAFALNTSTAQFAAAASSTHTYGFPGSTVSISAANAQNGIVWSMETHPYCTPQSASCGPAILFAHDAGNVATELFNSSSLPANVAGNAVKFALPTVANGHVYVGTRGNNTSGASGSTSISGELEIYGLLP